MRSTPRRLRPAVRVVLAAGLVLLAGCSRPTGSITGKVSYKGVALKGGNVTFVSTEGRPSVSGGIGEDGKYSIPETTAGAYKVCVETASLKPPPGSFTPRPGGPQWKLDPSTPVPEGYTPSSPGEAITAKNAKRYTAIPEQYADANKTELKYDFPGGSQAFDIELK